MGWLEVSTMPVGGLVEAGSMALCSQLRDAERYLEEHLPGGSISRR